jgi:hypothetical protein
VEISADAGCLEDTWTGMAAVPAPFTGRTVWTGSEMIVWGYVATGSPASGGRYVPALNSWTAMSETSAPVPRYSHQVVWTGREMIVWGGDRNVGSGPGALLNDGGRYDPTTDTWRPTTLTGAPANRDRFSAVWTGREMIVWGGAGSGLDGVVILKDGGRYDPSADVWTPVASIGAPPARADHTGVWTGTEMIVWGGFSNPGLPRDFGLYNPATNSWRLGSTGAMPAPSYQALSVWTGKEMIVWGGEGLSQSLQTGGRYDPALDAWSHTSISGATPQWDQGSLNAVWTGHEMIVWGGRGTALSGRYNPSFDSWVPVSSAGAPVPWFPVAVWTGQEMLVYGALGGASMGYSGRYCGSQCSMQPTLYKDFDHDGYGNPAKSIRFCAPASVPGYVDNSGDCVDGNAAIHPGAVELCNAVDDDCNGLIDDGLGNLTCGVGACQVTVPKCLFGSLHTCQPGDPSPEVCNGLDDDCNGLVDDGFGPGTVSVTATPSVLWPPNHRMADIHVDVTVKPACPTACAAPVSVALASVSSSEPGDARDIQASLGAADFDIALRAERNGNSSERVYTLTYTATDCFGVSASGQTRVLVPHDRAGRLGTFRVPFTVAP